MFLDGEWKEKEGEDPHTFIKQSYMDMLDEKQTMEEIEPKMIKMSELKDNTIRTKNILKKLPTSNRSPGKQVTDINT